MRRLAMRLYALALAAYYKRLYMKMQLPLARAALSYYMEGGLESIQNVAYNITLAIMTDRADIEAKVAKMLNCPGAGRADCGVPSHGEEQGKQ